MEKLWHIFAKKNKKQTNNGVFFFLFFFAKIKNKKWSSGEAKKPTHFCHSSISKLPFPKPLKEKPEVSILKKITYIYNIIVMLSKVSLSIYGRLAIIVACSCQILVCQSYVRDCSTDKPNQGAGGGAIMHSVPSTVAYDTHWCICTLWQLWLWCLTTLWNNCDDATINYFQDACAWCCSAPLWPACFCFFPPHEKKWLAAQSSSKPLQVAMGSAGHPSRCGTQSLVPPLAFNSFFIAAYFKLHHFLWLVPF